ncbi:MAG: site-specific DNA-methyltransferase [Chloroflexota bacterium]|nr:site-specific DNA-methyltransferase [Chloroflexota bacterium]
MNRQENIRLLPSSTEQNKPEERIRTSLGVAYWAESASLMEHLLDEDSVDLIMTSPPFGLVRKKEYGNADASDYVNWFRPFAKQFARVLKPSGSLVIDIGGAWNAGTPTKSLYHYELLLMLCKEFDFHLAQEFFWWNPSKLPTPAEWVNVRRIRVKDAVNNIFWLSPSPFPKASNRRVLTPYSKSMEGLLEAGYRAKKRPSGHDISKNFSTDNGAAIPPNLIAVANTESNSHYLRYCNENDLPVHPARFPALVPEYFIRFLTDCDDLVIDPFAGSCVTGEVSERLNRRWICSEIEDKYLLGAKGRFLESQSPKQLRLTGTKVESYNIQRPGALWDDNPQLPLSADGGRTRPKKRK